MPSIAEVFVTVLPGAGRHDAFYKNDSRAPLANLNGLVGGLLANPNRQRP